MNDDFNEIADTFQGGEGSAAKLKTEIQERDLFGRASNGLSFINRDLEDFREAAPITGITAAFFALGIPTSVIGPAVGL